MCFSAPARFVASGGLIAAGAAVSLYFVALLMVEPLRIHERNACVSYTFDAPSKWLVMPPYLVAILGALFVSSRPVFRWFGAAIAVLSLVSWRLYERNFISVWCFFAAAVSSMFFLYVQHRRSRRSAATR